MKNSINNIEKRYQQILNVLEKNEKMTTFELADALGVSISTVRRDLNVLEEKNDIIRKHGYCIFNYDNKNNFDESGPTRIKQSLARQASKYIKDYDTVFINSSSTALQTLDYLTSEHLTIVTNNLKIMNSPHSAQYNYILTGGEMRFPKEILVGDIAIETISSMNADICIVGCSGVSLESGVTTKIINEAKINELMIDRTMKCKILVADHRKIGVTSKFKIADISVFDYLITDQFSPSDILKEIKSLGVKVIQIDS